MYKPYHLIGLELSISVLAAALRGEPTGSATGFRADVAAVAKRDIAPGEVLDGEGGYTVWGRLMPAADSLSAGVLPIGLAHGVKVTRAVKASQPLTWTDVVADPDADAVSVRREMEAIFAGGAQAAE
jgi:predicted homoserine dehydrogenase-like protein